MRLVVGPLPASVYWRRRAMVLGGVALAVTMIVYSCGSTDKTPKAEATSSPAAGTPSPTVTEEGVIAPVGQTTPTPSPSPLPAADPQMCTDDELKVTAEPEKTTMPAGSEILVKLIVKNTSNRSCRRDVGADHQELYLVLGTERIWSSDHCDGPTGSDMRSLPAGHERSYQTHWNGRSSTSCTQAKNPSPDGPTPPPGQYQLFGRIGTDLSEPVTLTLT